MTTETKNPEDFAGALAKETLSSGQIMHLIPFHIRAYAPCKDGSRDVIEGTFHGICGLRRMINDIEKLMLDYLIKEVTQ